MSKVECEFCHKTVTKSYIPRHLKTGSCLEAQGKHAKITHGCEWCGDEFIRVDSLNRHLTRCKQRTKALFTSTEDRLREENRELKSDLETALADVEMRDEWIEGLKLQIVLKDKEISVLKENPTTVNNNIQVKLRVDKFVVKEYAPEHFTSLTDKALREVLTITPDYRLLMKGPEAIAKLFLETSLAGNDKLAFTDVPRQMGYYKDRDGQVTEDVKLRKLVPRLIRHIFPGYRDSFMAADLPWDEGMPYRTVLDTLSRLAKGDALNTKYARGLVAFLAEHKNDLDYMLEGKYKELEEYEDEVD